MLLGKTMSNVVTLWFVLTFKNIKFVQDNSPLLHVPLYSFLVNYPLDLKKREKQNAGKSHVASHGIHSGNRGSHIDNLGVLSSNLAHLTRHDQGNVPE